MCFSHRLVILNQRDPQNLVEDITPFWEVSAEKNYIFFRVPLNPAVEPHPFDPKVSFILLLKSFRILFFCC